MFLLGRPPTLRWMAAFVVLAVAVWVDLRPPSTVPHPFARRDVVPGEEVTAADVEMRAVPEGLFAPVTLPSTVDRPVGAGEPLPPPSHPTEPLPHGWWSVELEVPEGIAPGGRVGVVLLDQPRPDVVEGRLVGIERGGLTAGATALVAFPAEVAAEVASAAALGRLTVVTRAGG